MSELQELEERQVASEEVFHGRMLHVFCDEVELPDGAHSTREYLKHGGAVCMVPVTADGKVVMEHQYRYPAGRIVTEIPAGKLDRADEDRLEAAKRELKEETGITADTWISLGDYLPAPAYSGEIVGMYLAMGLHQGERHLDDEEFINIMEIPIEDLVEDILNGTISDGKTQIAILKVYSYLQKNQLI